MTEMCIFLPVPTRDDGPTQDEKRQLVARMLELGMTGHFGLPIQRSLRAQVKHRQQFLLDAIEAVLRGRVPPTHIQNELQIILTKSTIHQRVAHHA